MEKSFLMCLSQLHTHKEHMYQEYLKNGYTYKERLEQSLPVEGYLTYILQKAVFKHALCKRNISLYGQ